MKKILIAVIIVVIVAGLGYLAWIYFGPGIPSSNPGGGKNPPPLNENDLSKPALTILSNTPVFDYWVNKFTGEVYYIEESGQISKITKENNRENVSTREINNLISFEPSYDSKYMLISFGNLNNPIFSIFNVEENSWQPLPSETISATWSPNSNKLAYIKKSGLSSSIRLLNLSNKKITGIIKLNQEDLKLEWVIPGEIYLTQKPSSQFAGSIWSLNIKTKVLRFVVSEEPGLMVKWSPDGNLGLKFTNRFKENNLELINKNNQALSRVNIETTLPSKCDIKGNTLYCAVPKEIAPGIILPDDYLKRKFYSEDTILAWDTEKNTVRSLFDGIEKIIDAEKLTKQDDKIYFVNRYDRRLYSLEIKN